MFGLSMNLCRYDLNSPFYACDPASQCTATLICMKTNTSHAYLFKWSGPPLGNTPSHICIVEETIDWWSSSVNRNIGTLYGDVYSAKSAISPLHIEVIFLFLKMVLLMRATLQVTIRPIRTKTQIIKHRRAGNIQTISRLFPVGQILNAGRPNGMANSY